MFRSRLPRASSARPWTYHAHITRGPFVQHLQQDKGYEEDNFWSNVKLSLMTLAGALAMLAQFWPTPFPDNQDVLTACVISFFVINVFLFSLSLFMDGDTLCVMRMSPDAGSVPDRGDGDDDGRPGGKGSSKKKPSKAARAAAAKTAAALAARPKVLRVRTWLPNYDDEYRMALEDGNGKKLGELKTTVADYFTVKGEYAEDTFWDKVEEWVDSCFDKKTS